MTDSQVGGHAETERRFPHARPGSDDNEIARLEARREPVEVAEARGDAGHVDAGLVERGDALEALLQQLLDVREVAGDTLLREIEDDLLRAVDELRGLARPVPAEPRDLASRPDEPAQRGRLADDLGIVAGVRGGRYERCQLMDPRASPNVLEISPPLELVDEGDRVDRLASAVERERAPVDSGVALAVEVRRLEDLADDRDRPRREHHRPEDGLLCVSGLGRYRGGLDCLGHV